MKGLTEREIEYFLNEGRNQWWWGCLGLGVGAVNPQIVAICFFIKLKRFEQICPNMGPGHRILGKLELARKLALLYCELMAKKHRAVNVLA